MYMSTSTCPRGPTWTCTLIAPSAKALSVSTWTTDGFPGPRGSDSAFVEGAINVHVHVDMSTWIDVDMYTDSALRPRGQRRVFRSTWIHVGRKTRDKGAHIAPSQKALSRTPSSSSEKTRENLCVDLAFPCEGRGRGRGVVGHGFLVASGVGRLFKEGRVGAIRGERQGGGKKEATILRFLIGGGAFARRGDGGEEVRRGHRSKERRLSASDAARYVEAFAWRWYVEEEQRPARGGRRDLRRRQRGGGAESERPYTRENPRVEWKEEVVRSLDYDDDDDGGEGRAAEYKRNREDERPRGRRGPAAAAVAERSASPFGDVAVTWR
ncbi:hypothetical protein Scep_004533 [Stephania cephalantha]|uniref:Uncharacterized protein n=1 Tax=Stephania cephalantha TaxID=152367 RepID=A0AAP0PXD8_9MAGN